MILRKTTALALLCFLVRITALGQTDPSFALILFRSGRFEAAAVEFERFVYVNPDHGFADRARYYGAMADVQSGRYREAVSGLMKLETLLYESGNDKDLRRMSLFQIANIFFRQKHTNDFLLARDRFFAEYPEPGPVLGGYMDAMRTALLIEEFDWEGALQFIEDARMNDGFVPELEVLLIRASETSQKHPAVAGILSVVPGMGHIYAGRTMDGIRSFFINGGLAGAAVLSVVLGIPVLAALFIVIGVTAYGANIYGGVNAALQRNAVTAVEMRNAMLDLIPAPPLDVIGDRRGSVVQ